MHDEEIDEETNYHPDSQLIADAAVKEYERQSESAQAERARHIAEQIRSSNALTTVFWRVFIASPAVISLSVTFVGFYLSRTVAPPLNLKLLGIAWTFLLLSMVASLYRNVVAPNHATRQTWHLALIKWADQENAFRKMVQEARNVTDKATMKIMKDLPPKRIEWIDSLTEKANDLMPTIGWLSLAEDVLGAVALVMLTLGSCVLVYFVYTSVLAIHP